MKVVIVCELKDSVTNMKLITHNMLTSSIIKGVKKGFPLGITVSCITDYTGDTAIISGAVFSSFGYSFIH